jgi:aspartyl/asparaginyl-tRNA synthetase|tara:strand:+ start:4455 stop:4799 length:345 start_codon:yes stop_codon:yes gene_type:complete
MKENTILKIALVISLVGLVMLYYISTQIDVKDYKPSKLNENVGDDVKMIGTISKISDRESVIFIDVLHESPVTVVLFTDEDMELNEGEKIEVIGEVQDYKGKNEIIARKIRVIS